MSAPVCGIIAAFATLYLLLWIGHKNEPFANWLFDQWWGGLTAMLVSTGTCLSVGLAAGWLVARGGAL